MKFVSDSTTKGDLQIVDDYDPPSMIANYETARTDFAKSGAKLRKSHRTGAFGHWAKASNMELKARPTGSYKRRMLKGLFSLTCTVLGNALEVISEESKVPALLKLQPKSHEAEMKWLVAFGMTDYSALTESIISYRYHICFEGSFKRGDNDICVSLLEKK